MIEYAFYFLIWWSIGALACAWSFEWDVKDEKILIATIGLTGPLCIMEAIAIRNKP